MTNLGRCPTLTVNTCLRRYLYSASSHRHEYASTELKPITQNQQFRSCLWPMIGLGPPQKARYHSGCWEKHAVLRRVPCEAGQSWWWRHRQASSGLNIGSLSNSEDPHFMVNPYSYCTKIVALQLAFLYSNFVSTVVLYPCPRVYSTACPRHVAFWDPECDNPTDTPVAQQGSMCVRIPLGLSIRLMKSKLQTRVRFDSRPHFKKQLPVNRSD